MGNFGTKLTETSQVWFEMPNTNQPITYFIHNLEPTSNLLCTYFDPTSNLFRTYFEPTSYLPHNLWLKIAQCAITLEELQKIWTLANIQARSDKLDLLSF